MTAADYWPQEEIPKGWYCTVQDHSRILSDLSATDRGHHFRHQVALTRAEFLASGDTRKARYEALLAKRRLAERQLTDTMARIRSQQPHTYDYRMAQTALQVVDDFLAETLPRASREAAFHRLAIAFAQARGELNLDILKAPPIQEIDPDEQAREALAPQEGQADDHAEAEADPEPAAHG